MEEKELANFAFKKTEQRTMKIIGELNTEIMTINVNGEDKRLATLLSPFTGYTVEISIKEKTDEELDEPTV